MSFHTYARLFALSNYFSFARSAFEAMRITNFGRTAKSVFHLDMQGRF